MLKPWSAVISAAHLWIWTTPSASRPPFNLSPKSVTKSPMNFSAPFALIVEIRHINFKATLTKGAEKFIVDFQTDFGDKLKEGLDAEGVVQIHKSAAEITADDGFNIVGHRGAT